MQLQAKLNREVIGEGGQEIEFVPTLYLTCVLDFLATDILKVGLSRGQSTAQFHPAVISPQLAASYTQNTRSTTVTAQAIQFVIDGDTDVGCFYRGALVAGTALSRA